MRAFRLRALDEVSSTNEVVKRALEAGEPEGLAVSARRQTGGYGRQGRAWESPRGGLYLSLALRPAVPAAQLPSLSLVAGLSVRRALAGLVAPERAGEVLLKWPNDVLCAQGKLCGISLEAHAGGVCVGIGVNVLPPARPLEVGGKNRPAYLSQLGLCAGGDPVAAVAEAILAELAPRYEQWCAEGFAPFAAEANEYSCLAGRRVQMVDIAGAPLAAGQAMHIDGRGCLVLRGEDGRERAVASGEAHIVGM